MVSLLDVGMDLVNCDVGSSAAFFDNGADGGDGLVEVDLRGASLAAGCFMDGSLRNEFDNRNRNGAENAEQQRYGRPIHPRCPHFEESRSR